MIYYFYQKQKTYNNFRCCNCWEKSNGFATDFDVLIYSNPNISDEEDTDGKSTIDILANTKKILQIINSKSRVL